MEIHLGNVIRTWRNSHGYWVAKVTDGPFKNLSSWQSKRRSAVNILKATLDDVMKESDL